MSNHDPNDDPLTLDMFNKALDQLAKSPPSYWEFLCPCGEVVTIARSIGFTLAEVHDQGIYPPAPPELLRHGETCTYIAKLKAK